MIIICTTLIVIVAMICTTRIYPLWVEHDRKKVEKAMKIVAEVREENNKLRKDYNTALKDWVEEYLEREKSLNEIYNKIYELTEKMG